ncbi:MAG: hypothetical protein R3B84_19410 [Zavarzinella sp.]
MHRTLFSTVCLIFSMAAMADELENAPIYYSKSQPNNAIERLQESLRKKKISLAYTEDHGWLKSVLAALEIPESSQTLVFSKTSLQRNYITPKTPRAIYFNDDTYVGFCWRGKVLEISTADPELGTVFYSMEQRQSEKPRFVREVDSCTICHSSSALYGKPGHLMRSLFPDRRGDPNFASGSYRTDATSDFSKRFGGWYVTGTHGNQRHLGNQIFTSNEARQEKPVFDDAQNLTSLSKRFTSAMYLTPHSDLVVLMVLAHQTSMHNRIARATLETRLAIHQQTEILKALKEPPDTMLDSTKSRIKSVGDSLLECLLFSEEYRLTDPIKGTTTYADDFSKRGPHDKEGRSLYQLDLQRRLLKYPCSYLIYSDSFQKLPAPIAEYVLKRLYQILTDQDSDRAYQHLSKADKTAILEILRGTLPNLPEYWFK